MPKEDVADRNEREEERKARFNEARRNNGVTIPSGANNADERQKRTEPRDPDFGNKLSERVKREGGRSIKAGFKSAGVMKDYSKSIVGKYGWKTLDTFLLGFTTITAFSVVAILLAIIAIIVLDIRWVAGKVSKKIPPMLLPQSIYLGALNFALAVVMFMLFFVFLTGYCLSKASLSNTLKIVVGSTEWIDSCFDE